MLERRRGLPLPPLRIGPLFATAMWDVTMDWFLSLAILLIALAYSSVGLGGGSSYLAVMSFYSYHPDTIRPLAWGLNILVASISFWNYRKAGHFDWRFAVPPVAGGIIGGAIGARIPIDPLTFGKILAITLVILASKLLYPSKPRARDVRKRHVAWPLTLGIGVAIGIVAGVVGIGGGIILGPVILILGLADAKTSAATTALYVALVSTSALGAHVANGGNVEWLRLAAFAVLCLIGGFVGSRYGAKRASPRKLELIFGTVQLIAAIRLGIVSFG
jgi:uncharacterized membrane protein YfcA